MINYKLQITNYKFILLLLTVLIMTYGCTKVDKPVRGDEGSSPMAIVIDGDAPDSHLSNKTSEGNEIAYPYSGIPIASSMFKSSLKGLDYWKANHPVLVTGTHDPGLVVKTEDEEEMCLDCHEASTSCNNCHSYVGVKLITSAE